MVNMKAKELWPILPVTTGSKSLEDQLLSFSSLELPIISADRDRSYSPPLKRKHSYKSYVDWGMAIVHIPSPSPSPRLPSPLSQSHGSLTSGSPTQRTVFDLSEKLQDLCAGLCLDCLKGKDVCRLPHPDPWAAYRRSSELWFTEEAPPVEVFNTVWGEDEERIVLGW